MSGFFARTKVTEQAPRPQTALTVGLEQGVWMQADRGPLYAKVRTPDELAEVFGPRPTGDLVYLAVQRALRNGGGPLHVGRLLHYSDPTDASTVTAVASEVEVDDRVTPTPNVKFRFYLSELGVGGDDFSVTIAAGTDADTFKATLVDGAAVLDDEVHDNLSIDPTSENYFVTRLENGGGRLRAEDLLPLLVTAPDNLPEIATHALAGGSNGTAINDASMIGDATAGTGIHTLSPAFEAPELRILHWPYEGASAEVTAALAAYAESVLTPVVVEAYDHSDPDASADWRNGVGEMHEAFDSSFLIFDFARPRVYDTAQAANVFVPVVSEAAPRYNRNARTMWLPAAGLLRGGVARDVTAVTYNVGTRARQVQADALIEAGINPLIVKNGRIVRWGNETGLLDPTDPRRFEHTRHFLTLLDRLLTPAFDARYFDINNPETWKAAWFQSVRPILAQFVGRIIYLPEGFALDDIYHGDIDVVNVNDETEFTSGVNTPASVAEGRYAVRIAPLALFSALARPVEITIEATRSNVQFSDYLASV